MGAIKDDSSDNEVQILRCSGPSRGGRSVPATRASPIHFRSIPAAAAQQLRPTQTRQLQRVKDKYNLASTSSTIYRNTNIPLKRESVKDEPDMPTKRQIIEIVRYSLLCYYSYIMVHLQSDDDDDVLAYPSYNLASQRQKSPPITSPRSPSLELIKMEIDSPEEIILTENEYLSESQEGSLSDREVPILPRRAFSKPTPQPITNSERPPIFQINDATLHQSDLIPLDVLELQPLLPNELCTTVCISSIQKTITQPWCRPITSLPVSANCTWVYRNADSPVILKSQVLSA